MKDFSSIVISSPVSYKYGYEFPRQRFEQLLPSLRLEEVFLDC